MADTCLHLCIKYSLVLSVLLSRLWQCHSVHTVIPVPMPVTVLVLLGRLEYSSSICHGARIIAACYCC